MVDEPGRLPGLLPLHAHIAIQSLLDIAIGTTQTGLTP